MKEDDIDFVANALEETKPGMGERYRKEVEKMLPKMNELINVNFEKLRSGEGKWEIDWEGAVYRGTDVSMQRKEESSGLEVAMIKIFFDANGEKYEIYCDDESAKINGDWTWGEYLRINEIHYN